MAISCERLSGVPYFDAQMYRSALRMSSPSEEQVAAEPIWNVLGHP